MTDRTLENSRMRLASGHVTSTDRLVHFLYVLARDELVTGKIEDIIDHCPDENEGDIVFTNGWLVQWAIDAATRLKPVEQITNK